MRDLHRKVSREVGSAVAVEFEINLQFSKEGSGAGEVFVEIREDS